MTAEPRPQELCTCGREPGPHERADTCCPCPCHTGGAVHVQMCRCYRTPRPA